MFRKLAERDLAALNAATNDAALFGRDDLAAVLVSGRHRARFLHALTTQEVNALQAPAVVANAHCDAQGRLQALATMVVQAEQMVLWTQRRGAGALAEGLLRYRVAERVKVKEEPELGLLEVVGPNAAERVRAAGLALPDESGVAVFAGQHGQGVIWAGSTGGNASAPHGPGVPTLTIQLPDSCIGELAGALMDAGAAVGCHAAREALRIAAGWPLLDLDVDEGSMPMELGLGAAVSFDKGCYLGQEAIAMQAYRGRLRRHLCWIRSAGEQHPAAGWTLRSAAGRKAGRVGSGFIDGQGQGLGLALISRRAWSPDVELIAKGPVGQSIAVQAVATTVADALSGAPTVEDGGKT